jgi:leucyl-tRNA synthetase
VTRFSKELEAPLNRCIKKVGEDIENLKFNTAVAAMMSFINDVAAKGSVTRGELRVFLLLLNPFAPHITEEMWSIENFGGMVTDQQWPEYDEAKCVDENVTIAVQVCGKLRGTATIPSGAGEEQALEAAKALPRVASQLEGRSVVKVIFVPGKLINIVAK